MHVGVFAPHQSVAFGGVWQFAQWIAFRVGAHVPMHLALPRSMLDDMAVAGPLPPGVTATATDELLAPVHAGLPYRVLEAGAWGRILGLRVPGYGKTTRYVRQWLYGGSVEAPALLRDLAAHHVSVVHVPCQGLVHPSVARRYPYVINPHDYQHEHFPEFFAPGAVEGRRAAWYPVQRAAGAIVVHSLQTREDAIRYLGVPEERVFYAPYGPLATFPDVDEATAHRVAERLDLPERFVFYPARMWPHKNHTALLNALRYLKDKRGVDVGCVFTDGTGTHGEAVVAEVARLGLKDQVRVVGRVSPEEMGALYRLSAMVVVPSLFEQNSGPMLEAIHFGKAIAVSNLPELVASLGECGLVFDPHSVEEIANAVDHVVSSPDNRRALEGKARERRAELSWAPFVATYKEAYAYAAARR
jgi:glycosyltransferase involved in cell wall biosynthesis